MRCHLTEAPFKKRESHLPFLKKDVSYLTISDIHLYNDQNETTHITKALTEFMDGYQSTGQFSKLDIIFIAGDIFDDARDTKHPDAFESMLWMRLLMGFCARNGIKLRILEGTPGHDFGQAKIFGPLASAVEDLDFRYVEFLSFERMEDLGLTILYVPDEWAGSAAICKEQIIEMMQANDIEKFDIACMHGMFDFQLPDLGDHPLKHDSAWFLSIVRAYINIGHDHTPKFHERIIVQGSFDRMAHGEEHKKGGVVCHLRLNGDHWYDFIENKLARIYKTITVKTMDLEAGVAQIVKVLDRLPANAHVRISTAKNNPILGVIDEFRRAHPKMKFKKHDDKKQAETRNDSLADTVGLTSSYVAISLPKANIVDMTMKAVGDLSDEDAQLLRSELEKLL